MNTAKKRRQTATGSIMALFFVAMMSMLAVAFASMSSNNAATAINHHDIVQAQAAAESGLEYALYLVDSYVPPEEAHTPINTVDQDQAQTTMGFFAAHVAALLGDSGCSWNPTSLTLRVPAAGGRQFAPTGDAAFSIEYTFQPAAGEDPHQIIVTVTGSDGEITRALGMDFGIQKDNSVLEYAIASRGRMIITGDSTIEGDIYSAWNRTDYWNHPAPFETASTAAVNGVLNTTCSEQQLINDGISLATYDEEGNPLYEPYDLCQGYSEGVQHDAPEDIPGLSPEDYDTSVYLDLCSNMPSSGKTEEEYFPHVAGDYSLPQYEWSVKMNRHVYENRTFSNVICASGRNALFRNCTFDGILFINIAGNGTNNIRFEDCTFNGVIVTGCPDNFLWTKNCLYFTGEANFNNTYMEEATIIAPHFNVNLGNVTAVEEGCNSTLSGAVVGGIVDVRGNQQIDGTIISMFDTSPYSQGYVTNIGFADDGGSESSALDPADDIGVIRITPDPSRLLPSGMVTPIILVRNTDSYVEY
ncbi:MAG: pilus assembly PilX N-terminal domain-containing protein [Sedimentisphaerales bacterium]|nr:pilus assembly PilX N-terminal domain-containing protein [Sedimentisphaerales bacterium]